MTAIWETVRGDLFGLLAQIIILLMGLLTSWLIVQIGNAQKSLKEKAQNELLDKTIDRASNLAFIIVSKIEETVAKQLREAVKDGRVDREELVALSYQALEELEDTIGTEGMNTLYATMEDVSTFLLSLIEARLVDVKMLNQLGVESPKA